MDEFLRCRVLTRKEYAGRCTDQRCRQMEGPTVLVKVGTGDNLRDSSLPRDGLVEKSQRLENALRDDRSQEGKTGVISLPEDTPRAFGAFGAFYYYLFHGVLKYDEFHMEDDFFDQSVEQLERAIEAWVFADKYALPHMQDCAMEALCHFLDCATSMCLGLPAASLAAYFSRTTETSPLRKIAADYVVTRIDEGHHDAGELVGQFGPVQGFVQALHEAQSFHHDARQGKSF